MGIEMYRNFYGDIKIYCGEILMRLSLYFGLLEVVFVFVYCFSRVINSFSQKDKLCGYFSCYGCDG